MNTDSLMFDIPSLKRAKRWLTSRISEVNSGLPGYEPQEHYLAIYNLSLFIVNWMNEFKGFHYPLLQENELNQKTITAFLSPENYKQSCQILTNYYKTIFSRYSELPTKQQKGDTQESFLVAVDMLYYVTEFDKNFL